MLNRRNDLGEIRSFHQVGGKRRCCDPFCCERLLHVLEQIPSPAKKEEAVAAASEQLDKLIPPERRKTLKIKTAVRIGKLYRQIIQFVLETQTDLVSMGVRGRGDLDLAVFGSRTYRVMQLGPCPVLTVHV